jgi:AcrR family transcriptional regulator
MKGRQRLSPAARRDDIISAAVRLSKDIGYHKVSRSDIALALNCADSLVSHYLGTVPNMRRQIMRAAIANEVLEVIAQGVVLRDKHAMRAPEELRNAALRTLMTAEGEPCE